MSNPKYARQRAYYQRNREDIKVRERERYRTMAPSIKARRLAQAAARRRTTLLPPTLRKLFPDNVRLMLTLIGRQREEKHFWDTRDGEAGYGLMHLHPLFEKTFWCVHAHQRGAFIAPSDANPRLEKDGLWYLPVCNSRFMAQNPQSQIYSEYPVGSIAECWLFCCSGNYQLLNAVLGLDLADGRMKELVQSKRELSLRSIAAVTERLHSAHDLFGEPTQFDILS